MRVFFFPVFFATTKFLLTPHCTVENKSWKNTITVTSISGYKHEGKGKGKGERKGARALEKE